ncbi:3-oxoacyl- reductase [Apiospora arundinis]
MAKVDNEISGRLALVTGASGGIGAACARDLWQQGASLALTCHKNRAAADALAQELSAQDQTRKISVHVADMGGPAAGLQQLFLDLEVEHGQPGPDILVANAGYGRRIPNILDIPLEEFEYTLRVNLQAPFLLAQLSVPHMLRQGGAASYAASKAGLTGMMKNLANKHAHLGITFNDVAPAMIGDTGLIPDEKTVEGTAGDVKNIPVGRLGCRRNAPMWSRCSARRGI